MKKFFISMVMLAFGLMANAQKVSEVVGSSTAKASR